MPSGILVDGVHGGSPAPGAVENQVVHAPMWSKRAHLYEGPGNADESSMPSTRGSPHCKSGRCQLPLSCRRAATPSRAEDDMRDKIDTSKRRQICAQALKRVS